MKDTLAEQNLTTLLKRKERILERIKKINDELCYSHSLSIFAKNYFLQELAEEQERLNQINELIKSCTKNEYAENNTILKETAREIQKLNTWAKIRIHNQHDQNISYKTIFTDAKFDELRLPTGWRLEQNKLVNDSLQLSFVFDSLEKINESRLAPKLSRKKVKRIEKPQNIEELQKSVNKLKLLFAGTSAALAVVIASMVISNCDKEIDPTIYNTTIESQESYIEQTTEPTTVEELQEDLRLLIEKYDLNNESDLALMAEEIINKTNVNMSAQEIIDAIKFANCDYLNNKSNLSDISEVLGNSVNAGALITAIGSDEIIVKNNCNCISPATLADILTCQLGNADLMSQFDFAYKTDGTYDLYKIMEICANNLYIDDEAMAEKYGFIMNEIATRMADTFSLYNELYDTNTLNTETPYIILGIYNANLDRISYLTTGKNYGPRYGDTPEAEGGYIDGTYGVICSEELIKFIKIENGKGNEDCYLYTNGYIYDLNTYTK